MRLLFDIETNGLPRKGMDRIHCIVAKDLDTEQVFRFNDTGSTHSVTNGITLLQEADVLIGHNIVGFDIPVIQQIYPFFQTKAVFYDTLILSRMFFPDILSRDYRKKPIGMPAKLYGRHALEAWGYRLGDYKGEFGKTTDWADWSMEMEDYCEQDVHVCHSVFDLMADHDRLNKYQDSIRLEHDLAAIMAKQETSGWPFDVTAAQKLEATLRTEMDQLADQMREVFPYVDGGEMTPKRPNSTRGYIKDASFTKLKEFNPTSRDHIGWAFMTWRGWKPEVFTDTGRPKIDEGVLMGIDTEESLIFARILDYKKPSDNYQMEPMLGLRWSPTRDASTTLANSLLTQAETRIHARISARRAVTRVAGRCFWQAKVFVRWAQMLLGWSCVCLVITSVILMEGLLLTLLSTATFINRMLTVWVALAKTLRP
jgi:DNA polymerase I